MRRFVVCNTHVNEIKIDGIGGVRESYGQEEKYTLSFGGTKSERKRYLECLFIDGRMTVKWFSSTGFERSH